MKECDYLRATACHLRLSLSTAPCPNPGRARGHQEEPLAFPSLRLSMRSEIWLVKFLFCSV